MLSAFAPISRPQQHGLNATLYAKRRPEQVQQIAASVTVGGIFRKLVLTGEALVQISPPSVW
jgi:hypothetical protein